MNKKIGVVGATGVVGKEFLKILEQKKIQPSELRLFASDRSAGQSLAFAKDSLVVKSLESRCFEGLDAVFFSSGDDISKEWAPQAVESGAFAIDNSGAFRMHSEVSLVVPEINGHLLKSKKPQIISNPNCSTIQLVLVLAPLLKDFGIDDVKVATYQAVSGAGKAGVDELTHQLLTHHSTGALSESSQFAHPIAFNCIPQIGSWDKSGFFSEELKIMLESQKILEHPVKVSAWAVRIPALNAHSEACWIKLSQNVSIEKVQQSLRKQRGLALVNQSEPSHYPHALEVSGTDEIFVGRIHQDFHDPYTWLAWIVGDNLRKGAALNGVQIAQHLFALE